MEATLKALVSEYKGLQPKGIRDCFNDSKSIAVISKENGKQAGALLVETILAMSMDYIGATINETHIQKMSHDILRDCFMFNLNDFQILMKRIENNKYFGAPNPNQIMQVVYAYREERLTEAENIRYEESQAHKEGYRGNYFEQLSKNEAASIKKVIHEHIHIDKKL